jgi:hypothetical protein
MFEHPAADERRATALVESFTRQLRESFDDFNNDWERVGQVGGDAPATYSGGPVSRTRGHRSLIPRPGRGPLPPLLRG